MVDFKKKLKKGESAVVVERHEGVKLTSVGVTYGRKVNLGNYESVNLECFVWADVEGEDDEKIHETMTMLWALARGDVHDQPEMRGKVIASTQLASVLPLPNPKMAPLPPLGAVGPRLPLPQSSAVSPLANLVLPKPEKRAKPATPPPADTAPVTGRRTLTHNVTCFGNPSVSAGITTATLSELLDLSKRYDAIVGKGAALTEQADLFPDAWVAHEGKKKVTRLALTEAEGLKLLARLRLVVENVSKGPPAGDPGPSDADAPPDFADDSRE